MFTLSDLACRRLFGLDPGVIHKSNPISIRFNIIVFLQSSPIRKRLGLECKGSLVGHMQQFIITGG